MFVILLDFQDHKQIPITPIQLAPFNLCIPVLLLKCFIIQHVNNWVFHGL